MESLQLPLQFNPVLLCKDLATIEEQHWFRHFVTENYDGDWSALALRGPASANHPIEQLFANPGTKQWANTELYYQCPYFAKVMSAFKCELLSVRLMRLAPGSIIKEHTDHSLAFEDGEVRIHIPIQTSSEVKFWLNDNLVPMRAGQTWYLNVNYPHRAENKSSQHRVHLVLDCVVNDWLRGLAGLGD